MAPLTFFVRPDIVFDWRLAEKLVRTLGRINKRLSLDRPALDCRYFVGFILFFVVIFENLSLSKFFFSIFTNSFIFTFCIIYIISQNIVFSFRWAVFIVTWRLARGLTVVWALLQLYTRRPFSSTWLLRFSSLLATHLRIWRSSVLHLAIYRFLFIFITFY